MAIADLSIQDCVRIGYGALRFKARREEVKRMMQYTEPLAFHWSWKIPAIFNKINKVSGAAHIINQNDTHQNNIPGRKRERLC